MTDEPTRELPEPAADHTYRGGMGEYFATKGPYLDDSYPPSMPFEAKVLREAALACQMARLHNCSIEVHIGGRWGRPPVDVTVRPNLLGGKPSS